MDSITIQFQNKLKQFRINRDIPPDDFKRMILNAFEVKGVKIKGFADREGTFHSISQLLSKANIPKDEVFTLAVQDVEKARAISSKNVKKLQKSFVEEEIEHASKVTSPEKIKKGNSIYGEATEIVNMEEFESRLLTKGGNRVSLLLIVQDKKQLEEDYPHFQEFVVPYNTLMEAYYYIIEEGESSPQRFEQHPLPCVTVYNKNKKFIVLEGESLWKNLAKVLRKIQKNFGEVVAGDATMKINERPELSPIMEFNNKLSLKNTAKTSVPVPSRTHSNRSDIDILESLQQKKMITALTQIYNVRSENLSALLENINDLLARMNGRIASTDTNDREYFKSTPQFETQVRPETAKRGRSRSPNMVARGRSSAKSKEISSTQEKFILIVAELEEKLYISEETASVSKSLILEENPDIFRVLARYFKEYVDIHDLSQQLADLAEKYGNLVVRPGSPFPRKDQLLKLVDAIVRRKIREENDILVLKKLINEQDELVYAAFDVFGSDHDEEDLVDTLMRILKSYQKKNRIENYAPSNEISNHHDHSTSDNRIVYQRQEETMNSDKSHNPESKESSYLLPSRTSEYSSQKPADTIKESNVLLTETENDLQDLKLALKACEEIKNLPYEDYGMLFFLLKKEPEVIKEIVNDNGGLSEIGKAVPSLRRFVITKWGNIIKENFSSKEIEVFNSAKCTSGSSVHSTLQCFKYDHNLKDLLMSLRRWFDSLNLDRSSLEERRKESGRRKKSDDTKRSSVRFMSEAISYSDYVQAQSIASPYFGNDRDFNFNISWDVDGPKNYPKTSVSDQDNDKGKDFEKVPKPQFPTLTDTLIDEIPETNAKSEEDRGTPAQIEPSNSKANFMNNLISETIFGFNELELEIKEEPITPKRTNSDQGARTPSKYVSLLKPERADSLKGFQLRLHSSDNTPRSSIERGNQESASYGFSNFHQASSDLRNRIVSLSVIVPHKEDIDPIAQNFIDRFHDSVNQKNFHKERFERIIKEAGYLKDNQIKNLNRLMNNNYEEIYGIVLNYEQKGHTRELKQQLIQLADMDTLLQSGGASPTDNRRNISYNSFRALLRILKDEMNLISERQYKAFLYLYTEEDISILACHEVYLYNGDFEEFKDTLWMIEKLQYFKNDKDFMEKISDSIDTVQDQLKIVYYVKKNLPVSVRLILEKIILSGDTTVLTMYKRLKNEKKSKADLIHGLKKFALEKEEIVNNYEQQLLKNKLAGEDQISKRKDFLRQMENNRFLKNLPYLEKIHEMLENNENVAHSIFEVYDLNKDKEELIENIKVLHSVKEKEAIFAAIEDDKDLLAFDYEDLLKVRLLMKKKGNIIEAAYKVFRINHDRKDFIHTVGLLKSSDYF